MSLYAKEPVVPQALLQNTSQLVIFSKTRCALASSRGQTSLQVLEYIINDMLRMITWALSENRNGFPQPCVTILKHSTSSTGTSNTGSRPSSRPRVLLAAQAYFFGIVQELLTTTLGISPTPISPEAEANERALELQGCLYKQGGV